MWYIHTEFFSNKKSYDACMKTSGREILHEVK